MLIASQKRKENIAEYLLYMWQVEDIIRAFGLDIERIQQHIIDPVPDTPAETRREIRGWYESLIDMMRREDVVENGHLQINRNTIGDLADLHRRLLADGRYQDYTKAFYDALPVIVELRSRSGEHPAGEVETCFNALYATLLIPLITCLVYDEDDWLCFAVTAAVTGVTGLLLSRRIHPNHYGMGKRDGFLLTAMVWVIFSIFGMVPFMFCHYSLSVSNAFFEAMSGFTTTGASVLQDVSHMSHGVHIWRATMQWLGGMGIILFTLAVIPMLNSSGGMLMFNAEVTGITHDKLRPRISQTAKALWLIYFALTAMLVLLLWAGPMNFFDSLCHAFGAISTGGYSTRNDGIAAYGSNYIKIILTIFMFIGGVNFSLIFRTARGEFKALHRNDVFGTYVGIILVMYVLFVIGIVKQGSYDTWEDLTINPLFQIVSTITSTGFTPTNFEKWGPLVLSLVFLLMLFGACAGSTSGGAKIDRLLFLIKNCRNELYRCIYPHAIMSVRVNGRVVSGDVVNKVIAFLCIYMLLIGIGGTVLAAMDVPIIDAYFSAFSCMSNTGLGAGITGFGGSYDMLPDAAKWVLSFLMLTGRLEIFTVLLLLAPSFWRK